MKATLFALAVCTACYSPAYRDCEVTCASQVCPSGYTCNGGFCVSDPTMSCSDAPPGTGGWAAPTPVGFVPGTALGNDDDPTLTDNLLRLYVHRSVGANGDIYAAARNSVTASFDSPSLVTEVSSTSANDTTPELSGDGLTLYFASDRPGGLGAHDIWVATRPSLASTFGMPSYITAVNSAAEDMSPAVSRDGLTMVFASTRGAATAGDFDIYVTTRTQTTGSSWSVPQAMTAINATMAVDESPMLSADKLTIYFTSNRGGSRDLYQATRASVTAAFDPPGKIASLSTPEQDLDPWVSEDGKHVFFTRTIGGVLTLMESSR